MSFNIQNYPKLKEAIEKNNLVLFVGAGTSINLTNTQGKKIGAWNDLIKNILNHLKAKGHEIGHLEKSLATNNPLEVLDELEQFYDDIDKNSIYEFTSTYFNIDEGSNSLELHKKLFTLSSRIICTNYDKAFEIACPSLINNNNIILKGNSAKIERLKDNNEFLLKIHGCYSQENTMILFNCDYKNLYDNRSNNDSEHLLTFLSNLFYNKTILFIGYGMGDEEINLIFKNIQKVTNKFSPKHFIISKDKLKEDIKTFLIQIPIIDHSEINNVIESLIELKQKKEEEKKQEIEDQLKSISKETGNSKYEKLTDELFQEAYDFGIDEEFEKAIKKYEQITYLKEYSRVYYNWGNSLRDLSKTKEANEKEALILESIEKYKKAVKIDEVFPSAYNNWGVTIRSLAKLKEGKEKDDLLLEGSEKYKIATKYKKNYSTAFYNWGVLLLHFALTKKGDDKVSLLHESCEKFKKVTELNETDSEAFDGWGVCLLQLAKTNTNKNQYFKESEKIFLHAISLGSNANYNLSCLYALQNIKNKALKYLKQALENKEETSEYVSKDEDWDLLKNDLDFMAIIEKYKSN